MTIKTESPAMDKFDPTEAVNLWMVCNQAISKFIEVLKFVNMMLL